jgi:hypothetical protein
MVASQGSHPTKTCLATARWIYSRREERFTLKSEEAKEKAEKKNSNYLSGTKYWERQLHIQQK